MALGTTISQRRKELNLSQAFVAEEMGVSRQAVSKWETGQSVPSTAHLIRLAEVLGCDVQDLAEPDQEAQPAQPAEESGSKKDIRMQLAAVFGRVLMLVGFLGYMGAVSDPGDHGSMPLWFFNSWWLGHFAVGAGLTVIGTRDYYYRKGGPKSVIGWDLLFVGAFLFYGFSPFGEGVTTLVTMVMGATALIMMNIRYFIPVWRRDRAPSGS
ncbi:helix-turn-helix domain-containing protein [Salisediminibacterium selenitireducens]|uniref:Transcriptional regulator, XRE family n=1 Tax=Bacillus selenitireducens (strain ATCC 700615 / DSM 15326 / MLS10) TaxID=439292 RepID=D6XWF1_BACIE|nr:helix-turn-helix transcriptional regulator [Salisediminibacterium selenitireducens]ADH97793.1 transcriptional regulator, XRE family [[Bacillus] selenitireducens MLS10]